MPFTPSHAVVALPFVRTPIVPAAVAVGAMTPDLPLFVRGTVISYAWTHDLRWIGATVAVAFVLFVLWRYLLRPAAADLAPEALARRLPPGWRAGWAATTRETFSSVRGVLLLLIALVLGVASHIVWDVFTHEGRAGVDALPVLAAAWGPLDGYKWLQHGSSAVGLAVLAVWGLFWWRRTPEGDRPRRFLPAVVRTLWWLTLPLILAMAIVVGYLSLGPFTADFTWRHLAYVVLPPACAIWGALTIGLCVAVLVLRSSSR